MSRLMQMPNLYGVRGSIATQTMAKLTQEQVARIEKVVKDIVDDPVLAPDKYEFTRQLGNTIGGDYRSDKTVAESEFYVAVWRATVYLLYHRDCTYLCTLCGQSEYTTQNKKRKAFDRQYPICPYCKGTLIDGQAAKLSHSHQKGYTLIADDEQIGGQYPSRSEVDAVVESPVKAILGKKKISKPDEILGDKEQRSKWYSVWVWNYFRQVLKENVRRTHNKRQMEASGPAHLMALYDLINELKRNGHKYYFDDSTKHDTEFEILTGLWTFNDELTRFLIHLKMTYCKLNVEITNHIFSVKIKAIGETPIVQTTITTEDPVMMLSFDGPNNTDDSGGDKNWGDAVEHQNAKTIEHEGVHSLIREDWLRAVRGNLKDDICRSMLDIYTQSGPVWQEFSEQFGMREAAKSHLAKFFSMPVSLIDEYREHIKEICIELDADIQSKEPKQVQRTAVSVDDIVIVNVIDGQPVMHTDIECCYDIEDKTYTNDDWIAARVLGVRNKLVRLEGWDRLATMCPNCCFSEANIDEHSEKYQCDMV